MEKLGLNELRERFQSFFEKKGHLRLPSFSLIPQHDPSLLLINAGMTPLKPYFTGAVEPPAPRVTNCQKCLRTPDIDLVGKTSRHATFFEMLGNFSFGDYFKKEAISWAWEFLVEDLKMPADRLYATVYLDDDEAHALWEQETSIDPSHISRLGKEDNFWEHGVGPCGPCSEIHFDRGEEKGCKKPECAPGCDCDRFVEIWNLVFTQFYREEDGSYSPLEQCNIDTGAGLERLAVVMQGADNIFEVDTIRELLDTVSSYCKVNYGEDDKADVALRVITDHLRGAVMLISDGVLPSNEGRGYVLRRMIRRAARYGRLLGVENPFLFEIAPVAIRILTAAYPELSEREKAILATLRVEEERFAATVEQGLRLLRDLIFKVQKEKGKELLGVSVFKLHDTFGFPIDLTREIAAEEGLTIDENGFRAAMEKQRSAAREALLEKGGSAWADETMLEAVSHMPATGFSGYDRMKLSSKIDLLILQQDEEPKFTVAEEAKPGDKLIVVTPETVFYAEGGGQSGDIGVIRTQTASLRVENTTKTDRGVYLHHAILTDGQINSGDEIEMEVDRATRMATARNHTATHLLHKALRQVLGEHVTQAGSYVDSDYLRFDFTHHSAMTFEEKNEVERLVNEAIEKDYPVSAEIMTSDEAAEAGAIALFTEKYGDQVRAIRIGDYSLELCGGTHLTHTGQMMIFILISESGISAGVRRIEAFTGLKAVSMMGKLRKILHQSAEKLKTTVTDVAHKIDSLQNEVKELNHELSILKAQDITSAAKDLLSKAQKFGTVTAVVGRIAATDAEQLRIAGDYIRDHFSSSVVVLAAPLEDKILWLAMAAGEAVKAGIHCGNIIRETARITGGGGGGRPDMAQAGGRDHSKLEEALQRANEIIAEQLTL
ncbi:MAG: alanine--tRNA ligase [Clostridiaceae bacterium]|nr:alanine--tRNA ligase [Clostridiaceae bacterium]